MKKLVMVLFLLPAAAAPAAAQQTPMDSAAARVEAAVQRSGVVDALEALGAALAPELERAADQLSAAAGAVADRVVNDAELRTSAVRVATGLVSVAELVLVEQSSVIQEALRAAAERLEALAKPRERDIGTR